MITRTEKNKVIIQTIKKEKSKKWLKYLLSSFLCIIFLFILTYLYGIFIETKFMQTHEYVINDSNIPETFHGIKICHFSDLLYGSTIKEDDLNDLQKEITLINPDLVVFTGDLIDDQYDISKEEITYLQDFLKDLPDTIGKYAVRGEKDSTTFDLIMKNGDFTVLENSTINVYHYSNESITLIGLNGNDDTIIQDSNNYQITLIHNYDNYQKYNIVSNLVLAGHNLNGEIPFLKLDNNKYNASYYDKNIFISNGLGSIHKIRLLNHPSINVYRLYSTNTK